MPCQLNLQLFHWAQLLCTMCASAPSCRQQRNSSWCSEKKTTSSATVCTHYLLSWHWATTENSLAPLYGEKKPKKVHERTGVLIQYTNSLAKLSVENEHFNCEIVKLMYKMYMHLKNFMLGLEKVSLPNDLPLPKDKSTQTEITDLTVSEYHAVHLWLH